MTRDEFEQAYADRSGLTVEQLHGYDRRGYPCECGDESCEGWQMLSIESALSEYELGRLSASELAYGPTKEFL